MKNNQSLLIKAVKTEDYDLFTEEVQHYTSRELAKMESNGVLGNLFTYMLWSVSKTWGFELHWAHLEIMSPEEIDSAKQKLPGLETEIPENFDSSIPLNQVKIRKTRG